MTDELAPLAPIFNEPEAIQLRVLGGSLYPGAAEDSLRMVLEYCRAARLDPLLKPVHIVPMDVRIGYDKQKKENIYEKRDVIMPGIGLYRIQASRNGLAGIDEPVFGPIQSMTYAKKVTSWKGGQKSEKWEEHTIEFPAWCKVTVYRNVAGTRCPFTAIEYWTENYATQSRYTDAPNAMWERRRHGQIAKCAEAQALRRGFPELGSQPTAEEVEGRVLDELQQTESPPAVKVGMPLALDEKAPNTLEQSVEPVRETVDTDTGEVKSEAPAAEAVEFVPLVASARRLLDVWCRDRAIDTAKFKALIGKSIEQVSQSEFDAVAKKIKAIEV